MGYKRAMSFTRVLMRHVVQMEGMFKKIRNDSRVSMVLPLLSELFLNFFTI